MNVATYHTAAAATVANDAAESESDSGSAQEHLTIPPRHKYTTQRIHPTHHTHADNEQLMAFCWFFSLNNQGLTLTQELTS